VDRETIIRTVIAGVLIIGILFGWKHVEPYIFPPPKPSAPAEKAPPPVPAEKTPAPAPAPSAGQPPAPGPQEAPAPALKAPAIHAVGVAGPAAKSIVLGSAAFESPYDLEATVTARGAAVAGLALARHDFFRTVEDRHKAPDERAAMELVEQGGPFAAFTVPELRVRLKEAEGWSKVDLSGVVWQAEASDSGPTRAAFSLPIQDEAGRALLVVRKTFVLEPPPKPGGAAPPKAAPYQLRMTLDISVADDRVEKVAYAVQGPPMLPLEGGRTLAAMAVAGSGKPGAIQVAQVAAKDIKKSDELPAAQNLAGADLVWVGEMDKYFAVVLIPQKPSPDAALPAAAEVFWYRVSHAEQDTAAPGVRLVTKELPASAGKTLSSEWIIYAGPKDADLLEKYYGDLNLEKLVIWAMPCCFMPLPGIDVLSRLLATLLDAFYSVVRNYGVAVILLVIVLRAMLHPVTRWSTKSMAQMQKMAPKMQQIREEFAHDKERMQQELAKLGGLKSMTGCLPMFIQMPIWIALYGALGAAIHLRHASFLPAAWLPSDSLFSVFLQDLSAPDMLVRWHTPFFIPGRDIPLLGFLLNGLQGMLTGGPGGLTSFNILPVLVGLSMYLQQLMTPQPATAGNPQAEQQKKMMNLMSIFFALMLYSLPSGLCLYISASSFLGFFEYRYLRKKLSIGPGAPAAARAAPAAPPPDAKEKPLVTGRDKSIGERAEAWLKQHIAPPKEKPEEGKGKRRKK